VDGIKGNEKDFHKNWLGFEQKNIEAIIDLGTAKSINKVSGSFLKRHSEWIFLPKQFSVYTSVDGKKYQLLSTQKMTAPKSAEAADVVKISATKKSDQMVALFYYTNLFMILLFSSSKVSKA
jgi:hypothetical protein